MNTELADTGTTVRLTGKIVSPPATSRAERRRVDKRSCRARELVDHRPQLLEANAAGQLA
jgi:hypothetical protein